MKKQQVLDLVAAMPDEIDFDELRYRLHFLQKLEVGLRAADEGRVISHEELTRRSEAWRG